MKAIVNILLVLCSTAIAQQPARNATSDPTAILRRAREVIGFENVGDHVLHFHAMTASEQNYQSERTYPPFFSYMSSQDIWFDATNAVLRVETMAGIFPGLTPAGATTVDDGIHAESVRGEQRVPISRRQATSRALNVWAVIADWSTAGDIRLESTEDYRDYSRQVLARNTPDGTQRLFIDAKSGFPVKLDYTEPHYLWGQRHIEYVWSTWILKNGILFPGSAFRLADGDVELSQTIGSLELVKHNSAPSLRPPSPPAQAPADLPLFLQPITPQTTKISDNTWLLTNPGYNEAVALIGGEVYVFDATQGEDRARQDAEQIARLFPGAHKINVVVTDLAWPHVAGVRYWAAQGATIISHRAARGFLQQLVDRRWTLQPDTLERGRARRTTRMHFVAVDRPLALAGGAVRVVPIDGIGSEVALMAFLPGDKFLWASDYVQTVTEPSLYATEVIRAAEHAGIKPERVAAEHVPLTSWQDVRNAQQTHTRDAN